MKNLILTLAALCWISPAMADNAEVQPPNHEISVGRPGQITLTWQEFQAMWEELYKLKQKKVEPPLVPPVDFTLSKARYSGKVENGILEVTALLELDVLKDKAWVRVPFLPASLALKETLLDGQPAAIETKDGSHALMTHKPGRHQIQARFSLPYPKKEEAPAIQFALPVTAMTLIELELPQPNLDVKLTPAQGVRVASSGGKTSVTAALPPSNEVRVEWQHAIPPEHQLPTKLYVEARELLSVGEESIGINAVFQYSILHSAVPGLKLALPDGLDVLSVSCPGLREWKTLEEKGRKILSVSFNFPQKGALPVEVEARVPLPTGGVAELPRIAALGVERELGAIGVEVRGPVEVKAESLKDVQRVDVKELPPELWQKAKSPLLMGLRYMRQPYAAAFSVQKHQEIAVLTTAVDAANAVTLFTKEGLTVTHASYQVRNHLKQFMAFELPAGSELWSAFVNGQPVKPSLDKEGRVRVPLAKSAESEGSSAFPVEIIYRTKAPRFAWAGYESSVLPAPDVPVSQMLWSLYLPERFRFLKFWGDMEAEDAATGIAPILAANVRALGQLREEAYERRDRKSLAAFAQNLVSGYAQSAAQPAAPAAEADELAAKQADMEKDFGRRLQSAEAGVLPVSFQIPARGQLYRFGKLLVVGENPRLKMVYVHFWIVRLLVWLSLTIMVWVAFKNRNKVLGLLSRLNQGLAMLKAKPQTA